MAHEFTDHIEKFIKSLDENTCEIYYQAFDFSSVTDSRTQLMELQHDKTKVSFLNLEMVGKDQRTAPTLPYCILRLRTCSQYSLRCIKLLRRVHPEISALNYRIDCRIQNRYACYIRCFRDASQKVAWVHLPRGTSRIPYIV